MIIERMPQPPPPPVLRLSLNEKEAQCLFDLLWNEDYPKNEPSEMTELYEQMKALGYKGSHY